MSKLPKITSLVSNGYKVKFTEEPDKECGIGSHSSWMDILVDESYISLRYNLFMDKRSYLQRQLSSS